MLSTRYSTDYKAQESNQLIYFNDVHARHYLLKRVIIGIEGHMRTVDNFDCFGLLLR